jgi:hypothetical protein
MKKLLLTIALVLAIAGSMAAGTMAQYVKTASADVNPQYKQFNFSTVRSQGQAFSLKLAPGESKTWNIDVSNTEGGIFSETDMNVSLSLVANYIPDGLKFYVNDEEYTGTPLQVAALQGGSADSTTFVLKAKWNDAANNTSFQGRADETVTLNLTATQATTANFVPVLTNVSEQIIPSSLKTQGSKTGNVIRATYNVSTLTGDVHVRPTFTLTGIADPSALSVVYTGWYMRGGSKYFESAGIALNAPVANVFSVNSGSQIFYPRTTDLPAQATYTISYKGTVIATYIVDLVI